MQMSHQEMKQIFLLIKSIDRQVTQNFEKRTGISLTRYEMLYKLSEKGPLMQMALQQELKIDQAAITRHLKILEEKEFVIRNRRKENNREIIVEITETGKDILEHCDLDKKQFIDELFDEFTEEEVKQLQILVKKLDSNTAKLK